MLSSTTFSVGTRPIAVPSLLITPVRAAVSLGTTVEQPSFMPHCDNCEGFVTGAYVRVFTPPGMATVRVCPNCEDMVREGGRCPRGQSLKTVMRAAFLLLFSSLLTFRTI